MKFIWTIVFFLFLLQANTINAQKPTGDSLKLAAVLTDILKLCAHVDFSDPKVTELGTFYKVAPYIIYRGDDKARSWKDFANYANQKEKAGVDEVCFKINSTVNRDSNYKFIKYLTQKESEGVWHVIIVSYQRKGVSKKAAFAFLKIKGRFGLGDID